MSQFEQYVAQTPLPWSRYTFPGLTPAQPRMNYSVDYLDRMVVHRPTVARVLKTRRPSRFEFERRYRQSRTRSVLI